MKDSVSLRGYDAIALSSRKHTNSAIMNVKKKQKMDAYSKLFAIFPDGPRDTNARRKGEFNAFCAHGSNNSVIYQISLLDVDCVDILFYNDPAWKVIMGFRIFTGYPMKEAFFMELVKSDAIITGEVDYSTSRNRTHVSQL